MEGDGDDEFHFKTFNLSVLWEISPHYNQGNGQVGSWIYKSNSLGISLCHSLRSQPAFIWKLKPQVWMGW